MMNTKLKVIYRIYLNNLTCVTHMFEQTCVPHMWKHTCVTHVAFFAGIHMCSHTCYTHVPHILHMCCNVCSVVLSISTSVVKVELILFSSKPNVTDMADAEMGQRINWSSAPARCPYSSHPAKMAACGCWWSRE